MKQKYNEIISFIRRYITESQMKGAVIGISGGKDSTIVAKLLCDAIGKENVLGVLMPNGEQSDINDSIEVCRYLDIDFIDVNINDQFLNTIYSIESLGGYRYPKGRTFAETEKGIQFNISKSAKINIAPRLRMIVLYAIAQSLGYRVIGTGNASEQFIGWFTKWGDNACDMNPIAHLTCAEVIQLGLYMRLPEHLVKKTPADGLTGKSDEENFGFSYDQLDYYINLNNSSKVIDSNEKLSFNNITNIRSLHNNSRHKFHSYTLLNY